MLHTYIYIITKPNRICYCMPVFFSCTFHRRIGFKFFIPRKRGSLQTLWDCRNLVLLTYPLNEQYTYPLNDLASTCTQAENTNAAWFVFRPSAWTHTYNTHPIHSNLAHTAKPPWWALQSARMLCCISVLPTDLCEGKVLCSRSGMARGMLILACIEAHWHTVGHILRQMCCSLLYR